MADNEFKQPLKAYGALKYVANATLTSASTSNPTVGVNNGFSSIVRSTTGLFRLTLAHKATNLIVQISRQNAAALETHGVSIRAVTASTGVIDIATVLLSGPSDADTTGITIHVTVFEVQ